MNESDRIKWSADLGDRPASRVRKFRDSNAFKFLDFDRIHPSLTRKSQPHSNSGFINEIKKIIIWPKIIITPSLSLTIIEASQIELKGTLRLRFQIPLPKPNSSSSTMAATFLSTFKYSDSLTIAGISFLTAVVCEAISWLLIYRRTSYKSLKFAIDKASKKLDSMKTDPTSLKKSKTKKIDRVETSLKESSRDLSLFKFKSGAVVAFVLFVVFGLLNSLYDGKAVAKLPFVPLRIVRKMSHRGLQGDDATDCSMAFLYFLCSISIRTNLQKFLGFSPPRGTAGDGLFPISDASKTN
ncbi:hypothetical protein L1987_81763 [Smallanthus sonchifolius]|uniref:Uncharacterized protein n=1 Tax=Smallanthus sonchifolius TaxID=185202 RepID=A0ACB8YQP0_9ASTR|nr:hypothetical protein L1987_81763 [Smallanthus sonchifolius]